MFNWLSTTWNKFETWVASWLPGLKTKLVAAAGALGSSALVAQQYVSGLPLDQLMGVKTLAYINIGLFTLTFWFRRLSDKTDVA